MQAEIKMADFNRKQIQILILKCKQNLSNNHKPNIRIM